MPSIFPTHEMQSTHPSHEMQSALPELPSRVMNYRVTSASPTEELLTLGRIFAEVGDYAGSILDPRHLSLARRCATRLKKVVAELVARGSIRSADALYEIPADTLYEIPGDKIPVTDLSEMTVEQLYRLYRQWPLRHTTPPAPAPSSALSPSSAPSVSLDPFCLERHILRELLRRHPPTKADQLKIDYCLATLSTVVPLSTHHTSRTLRLNSI